MHAWRMNQRDLQAARRMFFEEGQEPVGLVREVVARSWRRCAAYRRGFDRPEPMPLAHLAERREASLALIRAAQPELETLAEQLEATSASALLTDPHGLILESAGSFDFLRKAERVALRPGAQWAEASCGTNAIGTALAERTAVEVHGGEHFLTDNRILTCAATPIFSHTGAVLGVLDISGDARLPHAHALGLVRFAAQHIEHRLVIEAARRVTLLRFARSADLLNTARESLLLVEDDRIVGANPLALRALGMDWAELLGCHVDALFGRQWRQLGSAPLALPAANGETLVGSLQATPRIPVLRGAGAPSRSLPAIDAALGDAVGRAARVLNADMSVLLRGETGVGKEVFARHLHQACRRRHGPFVAVNCAALPETLIESELFGYVDGAFTGARRKGALGRVREADGGVLFLDEIGDMPLALQARLLRVLQEREVSPLGGGRPVPVDFALVVATHRDLPGMVAAGEFREDLFYRLQDFTVTIPPLRERTDRVRLVRDLLAELGAAGQGIDLAPEAAAALAAYHWPGNVRQLASVLRTLVALAEPNRPIEVADLPPDIASAPRPPSAGVSAIRGATAGEAASSVLDALMAQAIEATLRECGGKVAEAARRLGVHRSTIYRQLARDRAGEVRMSD